MIIVFRIPQAGCASARVEDFYHRFFVDIAKFKLHVGKSQYPDALQTIGLRERACLEVEK